MKTIFRQRTRATPEPAVASGRDRCGGVGGHTTANCRLPALFFCVIALLPGCATRRYVREQIAINNCVQTLMAIDRENGILYAAVERSGPQRSEIGRVAHDLTVYDMCERLNKLEETTRKIREVAE